MLWFGWLGFNGGSAFGANIRAIVAIWNTMIAGGFAGLVWCALDFRYERRWSMVGLCSGTIAGLVAATPSSGYVHLWGSVVIGILSGAICNFATKSMCQYASGSNGFAHDAIYSQIPHPHRRRS
jgi:Amt family ammonium transporter